MRNLQPKHYIGIGIIILIAIIIIFSGGSSDKNQEDLQKGQVLPSSQQEPEETKGEELFGLTENQRKEILKELILCEDSADRKASKYYLSGCENCPEFIKFDVNKFAEKTQELTEICKEELRNEYNTTKI